MAASSLPSTANRIAYLDGLRGIAIGLVVLYHAWWHRIPAGVPSYKIGLPTPLHFLASRGYEGVSLFLVVSGFILALPAIQKRRAGNSIWFQPSDFFRRRILRILPPYYIALTLMIALSYLLPALHTSLNSIGKPASAPNILTHLLLIHNLTPYSGTLNGSFWSLGLEWQWYLLFPIVLLASIRAPWLILTACLALAVSWHYTTNDLWGIGAPPARLFEFALGVAAAHLVVTNRTLSVRWLWALFLLSIAAVECPIRHLHAIPHTLTIAGLRQPFYGIAFCALLLLGAQSPIMQRLLSQPPLVRLGLISYSVYLVHEPVIEWTEQTSHSQWIIPVAIALGIAAGALFYWLVEYPCTRKNLRNTVEPRIARYLHWIDTLWYTGKREPDRETETPSTPVRYSSAERPNELVDKIAATTHIDTR